MSHKCCHLINIPQRIFPEQGNCHIHTYATGICVMVSAHILQVQVEYSTLVLVPIPDAEIGIGAALLRVSHTQSCYCHWSLSSRRCGRDGGDQKEESHYIIEMPSCEYWHLTYHLPKPFFWCCMSHVWETQVERALVVAASQQIAESSEHLSLKATVRVSSETKNWLGDLQLCVSYQLLQRFNHQGSKKNSPASSAIKTNRGSLAASADVCVFVRGVVGRSEHMKGDLGACLMMAYVLGRMQLPSLKSPSYNTTENVWASNREGW